MRESRGDEPFAVKYVSDVSSSDEMILTTVPVILVLTYETRVVTRVSRATVIHHRVQRISNTSTT